MRRPVAVLSSSILGTFLLLSSGCGAVDSAVDSGMRAAGSVVGERVGTALGEQLAARANLPAFGTAQWNRFMAAQAQVFFAYALSAGGYWPAESVYEPGEWTRFRIETPEDETFLYEFERALLTESEGRQWWRITAEYDEGSWTYEALVDTAESRLLRLRAKDPEGNVGEIPVAEHSVYPAPQKLTAESLEGATTGVETVTVPAGSFTARRVEFTGVGGRGTVSWWLAEEVPGEVMRYRVTEEGEPVWTSVLVSHGEGASTRLDSF